MSAAPARAPLWWLWAPPVFWLCLIAIAGTDLFSGNRTLVWLARAVHYFHLPVRNIWLLHVALRKLGHFAGYAILGALLFRSWRGTLPEWRRTVRGLVEPLWHWRWMVLAIASAVVSAGLDEFHQSFAGHRTATWRDVVLDTMGATSANLVLLVILVGRSYRSPSASQK